MGLDRMEEFIRRAGLHEAVLGGAGTRFVHVTGTNGKGSVTAFVESILCAMGHRAGGFYSPFVFDPRERVTVERHKISPSDFARHVSALLPIGESLVDTEFGGVTEFELKTAMGFRHWLEAGCDWVALEVGLGGRLDATNVARPAAGAIVSIGLDHMNILGGTLEAIAAEKAGIVKHEVPIVVGEMVPAARLIIEAEAEGLDAPVWRIGSEVAYQIDDDGNVRVSTPSGSVEGLHPGIGGSRMPHNLAVAVAAVHAAGERPTAQQFQEGAEGASLPGRMQRERWQGVELILDGAHNAPAAEALADSLRREGRRLVLVAAMTSGHDPAAFFAPLLPLVEAVHLAPIGFHRAMAPETIAEHVPGAHAHTTLASALEAAAGQAGPDGLVVVTGSFYLVGEVGHLIGV